MVTTTMSLSMLCRGRSLLQGTRLISAYKAQTNAAPNLPVSVDSSFLCKQQTSPLSTQLFTPNHSSQFTCRYLKSSVHGCGSIETKTDMPLLTRLLANARITENQLRSRVTFSEMQANKQREIRCILERFVRLGNGLWLRRHPGYRRKRWLKIIKGKGPRKVYKARQLVFCTRDQIRKMEMIVPRKWKTPKWYVSDPYKGYDPECKFFYHPRELPWNEVNDAKKAFTSRKHRTAHIRSRLGDKSRARRAASHNKVAKSHRVKMFPLQPSGILHTAR